VGDISEVASGDCGRWKCPWDDEGFATVEPREVVLELEDLPQWIEDVKKLVKLDMGGGPSNGNPDT
jgi:hypothetical protein